MNSPTPLEEVFVLPASMKRTFLDFGHLLTFCTLIDVLIASFYQYGGCTCTLLANGIVSSNSSIRPEVNLNKY